MSHKTIIIISIIACLTAFSYSCVSKKKNTTILDNTCVEKIKEINYSTLFDSYKYIPLETTNKCLIGEIEDIQFSDHLIFIQNSIGDNEEILVFNNNGRFLNKVGERGNGPKEYLSIASFCVNTYEKTILLLDPLNNRAHTFKYNGEYINSKAVSIDFSFTYKIRYASDRKLICANSINFGTKTILFECDDDFKNFKILFSSPFTYKGGYMYAQSPITTYSNYFIPPMSTTLYQVEDDILKPKFDVLVNSTYLPLKEAKKGGDYCELFMPTVKKGFSPIFSIFETKKHLLIVEFDHFIIWNKNSKKGITSKINVSQPTNNMLSFSAGSIIGNDSNSFVGLISREEVKQATNYYERNHITPNDNIKIIIEKNGQEDNPILCFYRFKQ